MKTRLLDTALSSYESFSSDGSPSENLTKSECKALRHLSKNKNIFIQTADKGNTIVILNNISYICATEETLNDQTKDMNYIKNTQKRIASDPRLLKHEEVINKATYENIKLAGIEH